MATKNLSIIGERLNTLGSRKFKQIILDEEYNRVLPIAREQISQGAFALDICVALTEREDEPETMSKVIQELAPLTGTPLVIDTTRFFVMQTALTFAEHKYILNSTHFENGPEKAQQVFDLARQHGAAVIALTIDEQGIAMRADQKFTVARRLVEMAVSNYGLPAEQLIIDALTFTLATGDPDYAGSALETLKGIQKIKEHFPEVKTSLGVSNVSFGFPPEIRLVLNNVFLDLAVEHGLDMAIANPAHILSADQMDGNIYTLAEKLIKNEPEALQNMIMTYRKRRRMNKK